MTSTFQQELLRQYLDQHEAFCHRCGYNLHKLAGDTCPECGEKMQLQVGLVNPQLGWFLAGVIGLSASAGFSVTLTIHIIILAIRWPNDFRRVSNEFIMFSIGGFIVEALLLTLWLVLSRYIRNASKIYQILMAISCWLMSMANIVAFTYFVR